MKRENADGEIWTKKARAAGGADACGPDAIGEFAVAIRGSGHAVAPNTSTMQPRTLAAFVFVILAAFFFTGCQTNPLTGGWSDFYSTHRDEADVFDKVAITFRNEYTFSGHTNYQVRVQNLTARKVRVTLERIATRGSQNEEYTIKNAGRYKRFEFVVEPGGYGYSEVFKLGTEYVQSLGFDSIQVDYIAE